MSASNIPSQGQTTAPPAGLSKEEKSHLNQLVRDLVQGDANLPSGATHEGDGFDQIPYIVKQVFQASRNEAFSDHLTTFISRKEVEIERMCGLHYQEFVQSVDQLLKVREGTSTIKDRIVGMNDNIQSAGTRLLEKKKELVDSRQKLLNVELTLEAVQSCLFVLDISNRISIQIANKKYFSALRMIEELQTSHLKLVRGYTFSKMIASWLPQLQDAIRDAVLVDLKAWFTIIKEGAPKIGKLALELTMLRQEKANEIMHSKVSSLGSVKSLNHAASMDLIMNEEFDTNGLDTDSAEMDFTSLFQCIHIHEVLGKRVQLKLEFDESRRLQAEVILHSPILSLGNNDLTSLERYIQEIAGFFVIEATVISTTQDFRSRSSVETLWQTCTNKMNAHLFEALTECTNPDLYLQIKLLVTSFISTMEIYGYAVTSLTDLMVSLLDRYAELMKNRCHVLVLKTIEEEDDYSQMVLRDQEELEEVMAVFAIPQSVLDHNVSRRDPNIMFPKTLPFSKGLPQTVMYVKDMIQGYYKFAEGFSQQNHEIDDLLRKTLENLLQGINSAYHDKIGSGGISVVYQMMVNLGFFDEVCNQLEDLLMEKRYSARSVRSSLFAAKLFVETRSEAEHRIHAIVNKKSDSFMELVDYDWKATQPRRQASPYLNGRWTGVSF
ncbi:hypothetical protein HDU91_006451 [Kappamyces sp. JEL0680]|nr:hypothetical protein HDU91_006451 [Kappamyces sp. JEL0680]